MGDGRARKGRFFRYVLLMGLTAAVWVAMVSLAAGRPFRMGRIPGKGAAMGCGVCHVNPNGGGKRNPFGKDYENIAVQAGEKYTEALAGKDSDGDGFTNDQEFNANTHPGDPNSKPAG